MAEIDANVLPAAGSGNSEALAKLIQAHGHWLRIVIAAHVPPGWALVQAEQVAWAAIVKQLPHRDTTMHQQIWMLQQARVPITQLLNGLDQQAVTQRDTLTHAICTASISAIEDGSYVPAGLIADTLKNLPQEQQDILYARYRHGLMQSANNSQSATKLCNARIACDWINASASPFAEQGVMSRLLDDWLMQTLDVDSRGLLTVQITQNLAQSAALIQQQRVHGALFAACHPFTANDVEQLIAHISQPRAQDPAQMIFQSRTARTGSNISNNTEKKLTKKSSDSARSIITKSKSSNRKLTSHNKSSDRYQAIQDTRASKSYMLTHIAAGAIVLFGVIAMFIFNRSTNSRVVDSDIKTASENVNPSQVETPRTTPAVLAVTTQSPAEQSPPTRATFADNSHAKPDSTLQHQPVTANSFKQDVSLGTKKLTTPSSLENLTAEKKDTLVAGQNNVPFLFSQFQLTPKEQVIEIKDDGVNGHSCLEIRDIPGLSKAHYPVVQINRSITSGRVSITFSLKVEASTELNIVIKQLDSNQEYIVGPNVYLSPGGRMGTGPGRRSNACKLPLGEWVALNLEFNLSNNTDGRYKISVITTAGQQLYQASWPYVHREFSQMDFIAWLSLSKVASNYRLSSVILDVSK